MSSIDGLVMRLSYDSRMRRVLLTLLLAVALIAGGLASAGAAFACPMQQAPAHSCCPDDNPTDGKAPQGQHDMESCLSGASCRTVFTPVVLDHRAPVAVAAVEAELLFFDDSAAPLGALQEYWRPPRFDVL